MRPDAVRIIGLTTKLRLEQCADNVSSDALSFCRLKTIEGLNLQAVSLRPKLPEVDPRLTFLAFLFHATEPLPLGTSRIGRRPLQGRVVYDGLGAKM